MDRKFSWYYEPPEWSDTPERLSVVTGFKTDFWQSTFNGFQRDNGHFYNTEVKKDFLAEVVIDGYYEELYDQAGLMLGVDALNWIKTGIESPTISRTSALCRGFPVPMRRYVNPFVRSRALNCVNNYISFVGDPFLNF